MSITVPVVPVGKATVSKPSMVPELVHERVGIRSTSTMTLVCRSVPLYIAGKRGAKERHAVMFQTDLTKSRSRGKCLLRFPGGRVGTLFQLVQPLDVRRGLPQRTVRVVVEGETGKNRRRTAVILNGCSTREQRWVQPPRLDRKNTFGHHRGLCVPKRGDPLRAEPVLSGEQNQYYQVHSSQRRFHRSKLPSRIWSVPHRTR